MKNSVALIKNYAWWLMTPFTKPRHCLGFGVVAAVLVAIAQIFYATAKRQLEWDSFSYVQFHAHRSAIYPAFLDLFGGDTLYNFQHKIDQIATTQIALYMLATGFMLTALARVGLPVSALLVFLLAMLVNFYAQSYHHVLMTESLGLTLTQFMIGCLAMWCGWRRFYWLGLAMFFAMLGFGLRPNFLPFPFGIALIAGLWLVVTRPAIKQWAKTAAAIVVPLVLVVGFENAYYFAHHETRTSILPVHLFGKASLVLAIQERRGVDSRFYDGGFDELQPLVQNLGREFRTATDYYWAGGEYCMWAQTHARYENAVYNQIWWRRMSVPDTEWGWRVVSAYPATLARLAMQYYVQSFCVASGRLASQPLAASEFIPSSSIQDQVGGRNRAFLLLVHWGFLLLGVMFFATKAICGYRWWRRVRAWRFDNISSHEILGASLALLAFGYILFIAIFGVPSVRLYIPSFPLVVLAILLAMVVMMGGWIRNL